MDGKSLKRIPLMKSGSGKPAKRTIGNRTPDLHGSQATPLFELCRSVINILQIHVCNVFLYSSVFANMAPYNLVSHLVNLNCIL